MSQKRNTALLAAWTAGWVVTMAIANFGPKFLWSFDKTTTLLAIAVNVAVGAGMIWANKRYIQGLDDLQQKIQLEAMAFALGVGLVTGLAYSNLDVANVIGFDAEISHLVIIMTFVYATSIFFAMRRYR